MGTRGLIATDVKRKQISSTCNRKEEDKIRIRVVGREREG
jgi:hypothetical protein